MHRIDGPGATVDNKFTEGDPVGGIQATVVTDDFLNDVQEELVSILTAAGVTPAKGAQDQVLQSFYKLIQAQKSTAFTTAGTSIALVLTPIPAIQAYTANQRFTVKFSVDSGVNPAMNVSSKGDKPLKQYDSAGAKVPAVFKANQISDVIYDGADLVLIDQLPATSDLLNTIRSDVAAAAVINLTTSAPSTRNINVTGSTGVTSFVVSAGQVYFVRFSGSLTLTNGASIITQSGGNITTQSGDSCVIRATAANVVEVLCYTRGIPQALGDGQAWQDLTGSRSTGTTYTNSTGRPIFVVINTPSNTAITATVGGVTIYGSYTPSSGQPRGSLGFIVPPGITYSSTASSGFSWLELR